MLILDKPESRNPFKNIDTRQLFKNVGPYGARGQRFGTHEECQKIMRKDAKTLRAAQTTKASLHRSPFGRLVMQIPFTMWAQALATDQNYWRQPENVAKWWDEFEDMRMIDTKGRNPFLNDKKPAKIYAGGKHRG